MSLDRYINLFRALDDLAKKTQHLRYMEIGTYDGVRAASLLTHWLSVGGRSAAYFGFDLFDLMTPAMNKIELSKTRLPPSQKEVEARLKPTGAVINLFRGNTRETLPKEVQQLPRMSLIFQDGGHSLETAANDWEYGRRLMDQHTIYLLDDYYVNREDVGCRKLVAGLQKDPARHKVVLLEPEDYYAHTELTIRMVRVEWPS